MCAASHLGNSGESGRAQWAGMAALWAGTATLSPCQRLHLPVWACSGTSQLLIPKGRSRPSLGVLVQVLLRVWPGDHSGRTPCTHADLPSPDCLNPRGIPGAPAQPVQAPSAGRGPRPAAGSAVGSLPSPMLQARAGPGPFLFPAAPSLGDCLSAQDCKPHAHGAPPCLLLQPRHFS